MIRESLLYSLLMWTAMVLAVAYTYYKLKEVRPEWQLRAELSGSFAGLFMLFLLSNLVTP